MKTNGEAAKSTAPQPFAGSGDPLSDALVDLLVDVGIGHRLPSERELSDRLGISRTALRDRLRLLESFGVLDRRSGAGTYVQPMNPAQMARALDVGLGVSDMTTDSLQSVRKALELQAAREATVHQDPVLIAYMRRALNTIETTSDEQELQQADRDFHAALLRASCNPAINFFAEALSGVLQRTFEARHRALGTIEGHHELLVRLHTQIYDAIVSRDPAAAMLATDQHFTEYDARFPATHDHAR